MTPRTIAVLGMHRSGTSFLTGTLEAAGVNLGEVKTWNWDNQRGNRENKKIMKLHNDLLRDSGGAWHTPPEQVVWSDEHRSRRDEIIADYQDAPIWGFKDPRTLLVLDGWLEAIPSLEFVGIYRHPWAVARSLESRNEWPLKRGLRLWRIYNGRLLDTHERFGGFPLVSFDAPGDELATRCRALLDEMDLELDPAALEFFNSDMRHHVGAESEPLPPGVERVYQRLQEAGS